MIKTKRSKILYTLFLVLIAVGTLPLVLSGWLTLRQSTAQLTSTQREVQIPIAQGVASEISSYLESSRLQLSSMVDFVEVSAAGLSGFPNPLREDVRLYLEKALKNSPDFLYFELVSRQGQRLQVGEAIKDDRLNAGLQDLSRFAFETREVLFSSPQYLEQRGIYVLLLGKSILVKGRPDAALAAVLSLQPVQEALKRRSVHGNTLILTDSRFVPFMEKDGPARIDPQTFQRSEIAQQLRGLSGQVVTNLFYKDAQGKEALGTITLVKNVNWGVLVKAMRDEYLRPVDEVIRGTIAVSLVVIVIAAFFAYVSARRISSPINDLAQASRSIAQGNFGERVNIKARNEIGEFAENFNAMADRIEESIEKLLVAAATNRQLFLDSIQTLAAAIDEKDPYTRGHSERVTRYSVIIAEQLGLPADEIEKLRVAALLHDIGKIGIDDRILRKPDVLTPEEFAVMKQHPEKGFNIVRKISLLKDNISGIRHHHEQVDGCGYPLGLKGDEITMQAKIIGVADTFDAMTTRRPYQEPMSIEFVLERIRSFVGSRYDGRVVEALAAAVQSGRIRVKPKVYVDAAEQA